MPQTPPDTLHETRLEMGLPLVVRPRPGSGVATVDMWVATGSANEPSRLNGVSHFLEHMLFKGTERYGVGEIDRLIENVGGLINAGTSHDFTHYHVTVAAEEFDTALHVIAEVIRNSTLDPTEFEHERQVILEEYARKQDSPFGFLFDELYTSAFESGPYKATVLGTPESLAGIDRDAMFDYYHRHYTPDNMSLVIVGDVEAERAASAASRAFEGFDRPLRPYPDAPAETRYAMGLDRVIEKEVQECYGILALPAPALEDYHTVCALDVLQFVLGGGESSILHQELVEKRRLATSIHVGYAGSRHPDLFYAAYTCQPERRAELLGALREILELQRQTVPDPEELARARKLLTSAHAFSLETTGGESGSIGYYRTITGDTRFDREYVSLVEAVDAEAVREQARRWLRPEAEMQIALMPAR